MRGLGLIVAAGVSVVLVSACAGDGTGLERRGNGGNDPRLTADVQPILTANCAFPGCHAGNDPQRGMHLGPGQTFGNVVNVASQELPSMNRVTPSQPDNSYLVHKVQGTHLGVGGSGSRMPAGRSPLSQDEIDIIRAWVAAGAQNN